LALFKEIKTHSFLCNLESLRMLQHAIEITLSFSERRCPNNV